MPWSFNALDAPLTNTATLISFAEQNPPAGVNVEVRINGSGLSFDNATGAMGGTITSLVLFDVTNNTALQTVTVDATLTGTLATSVTTFLALSHQFEADTFTAWGLPGLGADHPGDAVFNAAGTSVDLPVLDVNDVVVATLRFAGTGLGENKPEAVGTVTSVTHLDANGVAVPGDFVNYAPGAMTVSAISYFLGNNELLYDVLTQGNDTLVVNNAASAQFYGIDGGAGNDQITTPIGGFLNYNDAVSGVTINLGAGTATGGGGNDTWTPNTIGGAGGSHFNDTLTGSNAFADGLNGSDGSDTLNGLGGNDVLFGDAGSDKLFGGAGKDMLFGGDGLDALTGGLLQDALTGGAQKDVFDFNLTTETGKTIATRDKITDFTHNVDDIDLKGIDASTKMGGNQAFKFIAKQAFHHVAGELHYKFAGANTLVEGDTNGDGKADFQIELSGHKVLTAGDFIL